MHQTITPSALSAASPGILTPKSSLRFWKNFLVSSMLLFAALLPNFSKAQTTLTIGTGTSTTSFFPIYTCFGYNYSQQTYLASEIVAAGATAGTPGFISSISFNPTTIVAASFSSLCKDWVVYLGNTTKSTFSGTSDWVPFSSLTKVYDGTVTPSGTGWFTISFSTPFYWDGTSNLVVAVDENTPSWYCTAAWQATSRTGTRGLLYYSDGTNPNPSSPPTANYSSNIISNIRVAYTPAVPCSGTTVGGSTVASATSLCPGESVSLNVTGATAGTGMTWQWESAPTATGPWTAIAGATGTSHTLTPPAGTTTYYRRQTTCTSTASSAFSTGVAVAVSTSLGVPYSENFESVAAGVNVPCATASPSFSSGVTLYYGTDYWKIINDVTPTYAASSRPGGTKYLVAGYYIGSYVGTADYWFTPGINLSAGKTYRFSYWHRMSDYAASSYAGGVDIGMYYSTVASRTSTSLTAIKPDLLSRSNNTYQQNIGDFSVPSNGVYYLAIKANNKTFGGYYCAASFDDINLIELPPCNTATAATFGTGGKANASPNVICNVPGTTNLSVTGTPPFSGLNFQWEVAAGTATSFASIAGATTPSFSHSITSGGTYFFRCLVTCATTGLSAYSDTVIVKTTPITPPYTEDFEGGTPGTNLPCAGFTFSWSSGAYWFLQGGPYASYAPGIVNRTPGGSKYLHAGYALGNVSSGGDEYWFTPGLALTAAKAYNVSFWYSNSASSSSYASIGTTIGVAAGTAQSKAAMTITAGSDTVIYNNLSMTPSYNQLNRGFIAPTTGTYFVGLKVNNSGWGYYGHAIDDIGITQLPPCSAKPTAGAAAASPSLICTSGTSTLSLPGVSVASDLSFQWQEEMPFGSGTWVAISGATSPSYTTPVLTAGPNKYRCVVTCGLIAAPNSDISTPVVVSVGALDLPYFETFETGTAGVNMPCAAVAGTWSGTSTLYWNLRSGDYSTSYPGIKNRTPGGSKYIYCGYYNGPFYSSGDQFFWFTPALKMVNGKAYKVSFWYNGTGLSSGYNGLKMGIYAGTAQNAAGMILRAGGIDTAVNGAASTYAQFSRSFVAHSTANHFVGIKMYHTGYNFPAGVIDDIGIEQLPDCAAKPVAGAPDAFPYTLCASGTTRLRLSGTSVASGIQYQWQQATSATGPWTNSTAGTGANTGSYLTGTIAATTWFRCIVTCSANGLRDTSSVLVMNIGAITPPYTEDFERAIVGTNVPCAAVSGTWSTASGTSFWTIKGAKASSTYPVDNTTPGGSQYLYAGTSATSTYYWFTPAIRFTAGATYEFSYWYLGSGYAGGSTTLGMYYGTSQTAAAMTTAIRPDLTGINTGSKRQIVGRFVAPATGNYFMGIRAFHTIYSFPGIAIDDIGLEQLPPCTGAPTVGTISSAPSMLCTAGGTVALNMDLAGVSKVAGLVYDWYVSTSGPTGPWTRMTATSLTSPAYTTGATMTTSWYHASVKCSATGDSTLSSVIKVDVGAVTPPYIETFETVTPGVRPACSWNTSTWGSTAYWNSMGSPFSPSYPAIDNRTPGGSRYLLAGYILGTYYLGAKQYWFTPAIRFDGGKLYQFNFWYNGSGYTGGKTTIEAFYGTAQTAAAMTTAIGTGIVDANTSIYKQFKHQFTPASSGNYHIGIAVNHTNYTYPGIAIDDIGLREVPPCSSPVVAGTIVADPAHICTVGGTTMLELEGSTLATGLVYDWLSSTSATGPFVSTGGTSMPYTTDPLSAPTWFRCVVKCAATGAVDTTPIFRVGVGGFDIPYKEDFESTPAGMKPICSDANVWGNSILWNTQSVSYGSLTNNTPGGKNFLIGGYYLGYYDYAFYGYTPLTHDNFWYTPGLNLDNRYKYQLSFFYQASSSPNRMGVFYGTSQSVGAMTNTLRPLGNVSNTAYVKFDTTFKPAASRVYYIGFQKTTTAFNNYAYPGIAFDDINVNYAPCDGTPFVGTTSSTMASGTLMCVGTPITLKNSGSATSLVPGIRHQWYRRPVGSTGVWTRVVGARDTVLSADTLVGFEYSFAVVCTNTNDSVMSAAFQIPAHVAHPPVSISPSITPVNYCLGDSVRFSATNFTGAVYDWMIDSVVVPGWKFSDYGGTDPGTVMVRVSSPLSPCPAWSNKVEMVINDPGYSVTITKPSDSIICAGTSMLLSATSSKTGVTYQWRKDNIDIPGATGSSYLVTTGGFYRVMAYDGTSTCKAASRNIMITVKPNPPAVISVPGGTATACENEGVLLNANLGGFSYEWTRGGSTIFGWRDSSQLVKNSGVYAVKVRSKDGCVSVSSSVTVNILLSPTPVITKSGLVLSATSPYISYQWIRNGVPITGSTSSTYNLVANGIYKLLAKDANGCEGESNPIEVIDNRLLITDVTLQKDQIKIYPNPTESKVYIESPVAVMVKVKDVTGKTIIESQEVKEIDLSKYADGVYLFMVSDKDGNVLVKQQRVSKVSKK